MKILFLGLIALVLVSCADDAETSAEYDMILTAKFQQISADVGDDVQLEILIDESTQSVFGICLQLQYDEDYLIYDEQSGMTTGDIFGENYLSFTQSENGIVHVSITLQQGEDALAGTGILCTLPFNCLMAGNTDISIISDNISVYDLDGNIIDLNFSTMGSAELLIN